MPDDSLWSGGLHIVQTLCDAGHQAHLVGGCVRDRLLGRPLKDVDIATSARPEEVSALFAHTIPTGIRHGTVTVVHQGKSYEVTTYRMESGYSDGRRPDTVNYVGDIAEDLARRDFTVNAIAVDLSGACIDPFQGRRDLALRFIRCVGDPRQRFAEDALRMLRAIRFAAALDFRLLKSVWRGIRTQSHRLRQIAMERIGAEWDNMMAGPDPDRACAMLRRSGLLACLKEPLPGRIGDALAAASTPDETGKVHRHRKTDRRRLGTLPETDLRWMALLSDLGATSGEAADFCRTLRLGGKRASRIAAGVEFGQRIARAPEGGRSAFVKAVLDLGRAAAQDWLTMQGDPSPYREWLHSLPVDHLSKLAINGDTLIRQLDKSPGPWVAQHLRWLLEEVALGSLPNERDALIRAAKCRLEER
jgi:tRNA nucleotidyltransferase (CCA-adding enzyme)